MTAGISQVILVEGGMTPLTLESARGVNTMVGLDESLTDKGPSNRVNEDEEESEIDYTDYRTSILFHDSWTLRLSTILDNMSHLSTVIVSSSLSCVRGN